VSILCTQHGGRPPAPTVLTALRDRAEVHLDGGIVNGGVVTGAAFGARACPVGRACRTGSRPVVSGG